MQKTIIIILILVALGLVFWFVATETALRPVEQTATTTTATNTEPQVEPGSDQESEAESYRQYESDPYGGVQFTLTLPTTTVATKVRPSIYEFKHIGPGSEPNTEITDGYYISVSLHDGVLPAAYEGLDDALGSTSTTTLAGYAAITYDTRSALTGKPVPHHVFQPADDMLFDIAYSVYGPQADAYRIDVQKILASFTVASVATSGAALPTDVAAHIEALADRIKLATPTPQSVIESPQLITGEARGSWFFEADFPVVLTDWDGRIIAEDHATAEGSWMTEDFVSFRTTLEFESPYEAGDPAYMQRGTLILQRANPSGLPEHDAALEIPVRFGTGDE